MYVFIPARPDMGEIALVDRVPLPLELGNRFRHVHGVPYDDGIGHQIEATGLVDEVFAPFAAQFVV
jgi:hypothetical protein